MPGTIDRCALEAEEREAYIRGDISLAQFLAFVLDMDSQASGEDADDAYDKGYSDGHEAGYTDGQVDGYREAVEDARNGGISP